MQKEFQKTIEYALADFDPFSVTRVQCWSFAWHQSRILCVGKNHPRTDPWNVKNPLHLRDGRIHFEKGSCSELILAKRLINLTRIPFRKITMINIRLTKNKTIGNSKPCSSCKSLISSFLGFKAIYHTLDNGNFIEYVP